MLVEGAGSYSLNFFVGFGVRALRLNPSLAFLPSMLSGSCEWHWRLACAPALLLEGGEDGCCGLTVLLGGAEWGRRSATTGGRLVVSVDVLILLDGGGRGATHYSDVRISVFFYFADR